MRIVKEAFLVAAAREHSEVANSLNAWRKFVKAASWRDLVDVQRTYPDTDTVKVGSGRQVLVFRFNSRGNEYRLIVAAHFERRIVYTIGFLTQAEYSKNRWPDAL